LANNYVYNSTYAYAENKVINGLDLEGAELYPWMEWITDWFMQKSFNANNAVAAGYKVGSGEVGNIDVPYSGPAKDVQNLADNIKTYADYGQLYIDIYEVINTMYSVLPVGEAGALSKGGMIGYNAIMRSNTVVRGALEESGERLFINSLKVNAQGDVDKFIVIGRSMDERVRPFAEELAKKGLNVETWSGFNKDLGVLENAKNNANWFSDRVKNGYSVIDIGLDEINYKVTGNFMQDHGSYYSVETMLNNKVHWGGTSHLMRQTTTNASSLQTAPMFLWPGAGFRKY